MEAQQETPTTEQAAASRMWQPKSEVEEAEPELECCLPVPSDADQASEVDDPAKDEDFEVLWSTASSESVLSMGPRFSAPPRVIAERQQQQQVVQVLDSLPD